MPKIIDKLKSLRPSRSRSRSRSHSRDPSDQPTSSVNTQDGTQTTGNEPSRSPDGLLSPDAALQAPASRSSLPTHTRQDVPQPAAAASEATLDTTVPETTQLPETSMWDIAFDALAKEKPDIVEKYLNLLSPILVEDRPTDPGQASSDNELSSDPVTRRDQLKKITKLGLEHMENKRVSVTILDHKFVLQDQVKNIAAVFEWADKNLKDAIKEVPHAAVIWAGVVLILPLLKNHPEEEEANQKGFTSVTSKMRYYNEMETLFLPTSMPDNVKGDMRSRLIELYKIIIDFQVQTILRFYRSRTKNYFRNVVKYDDWDSLKKSIDNMETEIIQKFMLAMAGTSLDVGEKAVAELQGLAKQAASINQQLERSLGDLEKTSRGILEIQEKKFQAQMSAEEKKCMQQLLLSDPRSDKRRIEQTKGGIVEGCSSWIFSHPDYEKWQTDKSTRMLWIKGGPGKGKTMLMINIIDELEKTSRQRPDYKLLSYFFCQGTDNKLNTASAVLRGLIHQLIEQDQDPAKPMFNHLKDKYDQMGTSMYKDNNNIFVDLSDIFKSILTEIHRQQREAYLLVDALDECDSDLEQLLDLIRQTTTSSASSSIQWIVSSRIVTQIDKHLAADTLLNLEVNQDTVSIAIDKYIDYKISQLKFLDDDNDIDDGNDKMKSARENEHIREKIRKTLHENAEGTFLWVALVCKELKNANAYYVIKILNTFPTGLDPLYGRMVKQLNNRGYKEEFCLRALTTMALAKSPLHWKEFRLLADLENQCRKRKDIQDIVDDCGSFLTVRQDHIYFIHQSAKDYLVDLNKGGRDIFAKGTRACHFDLFTRALDSLDRKLRRDIYCLGDPGILFEDITPPQNRPLDSVQYAAAYWIDHFCAAAPEETAAESSAPSWRQALSDNGLILSFLAKHFLHWIESLSLLDQISVMVRNTRQLLRVVRASNIPPLSALKTFLEDAERFVLSFRDVMEQAPLQIYASALVFCPCDTRIKQRFWDQRLPIIESVEGITGEWDPCLQVLELPRLKYFHEIMDLIFSPDSKRLVSKRPSGVASLWDTDTGELLGSWGSEEQPVTYIAFWPDQSTFAASFSHEIILCDAASGKQKERQSMPWNATLHAFSPDGRTVAMAMPKTIRIWDFTTGEMQHDLETDNVEGMKFSPDGGLLVMVCSTGEDESKVQIWDTSSGILLSVLPISESADSGVNVAFSADGKLLAITLLDSDVSVFDIQTAFQHGNSLRFHQTGRYSSTCILSSHSLMFLASNEDRCFKFFDATDDSLVATIKIANAYMSAACVSPDESLIASAYQDGTVRIWSLERLLVAGREGSKKFDVYDWHKMFLSSERSMLATYCDDSETCKLWNVATGRLVLDVNDAFAKTSEDRDTSPGEIFPVKISPNGALVLYRRDFSQGVDLILLDLTTLELQTVLHQDFGKLRAHNFSPDSKLLAVATTDSMDVWDVVSKKMLLSVDAAFHDPFCELKYSPDGNLLFAALLTSRSQYMIRVWDARTGAFLYDLKHPSDYNAAKFSVDCTLLVVTSDDNVFVLDAWTGEVQHQINSGARLGAILRGNHAIILYDGYGNLKSIDLQTDELLWTLKFNDILEDMNLTDDNRHVRCRGVKRDYLLKLGETQEDTVLSPLPRIGMHLDEDWVSYNEKRVLWLPTDYRISWRNNVCCGTTLILSRGVGQPTFIQFSEQHLEAALS